MNMGLVGLGIMAVIFVIAVIHALFFEGDDK